jgi:hypothetical protein
MRKLIPYFIALIVLGAMVGYFIYHFSPSTMEKRESSFAVSPSYLTKIVLTNTKGQKMTLLKKQDNWWAQGTYPINEEALNMLLNTISKVTAIYPAPSKAQQYILTEIHKSGIKCELYNTDTTQPEKVYWVGGTDAEATGSYLLMVNDGVLARQPYFVRVTGTEIPIGNTYNPKLDRWRTRWIIKNDAATIQRLGVSYLHEPARSFTIERVNQDSFTIANHQGEVISQPKLKYIIQYLGFYSALSLESYENQSSIKDSISHTLPFCRVSLTRTDSSHTDIVIHYKPIDQHTITQFDDDGKELLHDIERYLAFINEGKDFVLIQYYVWGKTWRSYDDFFVKPTPKQPS